MMERDAGLEEAGELGAGELVLGGGEGKRGAGRERGGQLEGKGLGGLASRGEEKDGAEVGAQGVGDGPWPPSAEGGGRGVGEVLELDFLERHGAFGVGDEFRVASDAFEPGDDVLGVGDGAAEEEKLRFWRGHGDGLLVVDAADGVGDHLVFVDDEQSGAASGEEADALGFEGGDEDGAVEGLAQVACGDADLPSPFAPLGEFVIGERAGGDGEDGLPFKGGVEEFEDEGFAGTGGRVNHDIASLAQGLDGALLPEV
ncbi:MAG: hypothetical protein RLZZ142_1028, partial [Verrucomicrobiota bacterium]